MHATCRRGEAGKPAWCAPFLGAVLLLADSLERVSFEAPLSGHDCCRVEPASSTRKGLVMSEAYGAVIGGSVALVLAAIAWLIRDWRVVIVVYTFLGVIAGLGLLAATDAWP